MSTKASPCSLAFPSPAPTTECAPPPAFVFFLSPSESSNRVGGGGGVMQVLSRDMDDIEDREHQRVCLRARIRPPGCRDLDFLVTHLTLSDPAR